MTFMDLKSGDKVIRLLGGEVPMEMTVYCVNDDAIFCVVADAPGPCGLEQEEFNEETWPGWKFCRKTGVEIDEELGWGPQFGRSGSFLKITGNC